MADTIIDLVTAEELGNVLSEVSAAIATAKDACVAKEAGKGLSQENFTIAEKTKLSGVEAGAKDNVVELDSSSEFPSSGVTGKIYVAKDTNKTYRWSGTAYVEIGGGSGGGGDYPPSGGVPKADLAEAVQASLGKADSAIQGVKVNGTALTPDSDKVVNVSVPTSASDLSAVPTSRKVNGKALSENVTLTASDVGALGNTGDQTIGDGSLTIEKFDIDGGIWLQVKRDIQNGLALCFDSFQLGNKNFALPSVSGILALLSDMYAAVQQIAPDFTLKAYALNELCSYNGVVYRCKSSYTATASSAKPNADTTHWEAKKVSELFLPLTGADALILNIPAGGVGNPIKIEGNRIYVDYGAAGEGIINIPLKAGTTDTMALLSDIAPAFSASATYEVNKLCVYVNKLYRCTTEHQGAWNSYHFAEATVEDVLAAIRSALDLKAPLASPAFTGTPTAPNLTDQSADGQVANKKYVDDKVAGVPLRYDMPTAVALVAANDEATLVCADRAVTNATIAAGFSTLNLTFPTAVTGKVRDFYLRIVVAAGESAPALSIPQGITIENPDGAVPEIADGETSAASTTVVWFSETAPNIFTAKSETVKEVA